LDFLKVVETANQQTELLKTKADLEETTRIWDNFEKYALY